MNVNKETIRMVDLVVTTLATLLPTEEVAVVLNATLGAYDDLRLDDPQAWVAQRLFDRLSALRPEAVEVAQQM